METGRTFQTFYSLHLEVLVLKKTMGSPDPLFCLIVTQLEEKLQISFMDTGKAHGPFFGPWCFLTPTNFWRTIFLTLSHFFLLWQYSKKNHINGTYTDIELYIYINSCSAILFYCTQLCKCPNCVAIYWLYWPAAPCLLPGARACRINSTALYKRGFLVE